ncbi:MAG: copper amine oxidase N-terminal domain-containing protein [Oscillospiraceae bacterium]|nr:copper amine oxidase N-terminal domain-containing protein [Oscillospiraceae bacterium]
MMKKFLSVIIILTLVMSFSTLAIAAATTLITPTEEITLTQSGSGNNPSAWTRNGEAITSAQYDAEINRIYQGATARLISFDADRRAGTTESGGSMTRSAAMTMLGAEQAPWGAAYRAILAGVTTTDYTWGGNSVAIHDIAGSGVPDLIFAAGDPATGGVRINFFVYRFDGNRANRIIFIEHLEAHVSNTTYDAYVTSAGALIVRGGNGGGDGHDMFFSETFHIFRNLGSATTPTSPTTPTAPISVYLDGTLLTFDVPPMLVDGRVLVPLRTIFEALGAEVDWDEATRTVTATRAGTTVSLTISSTTARVNGQPVTLDVPAMTVDGRTLVPLRFVGESLNAGVNWNPETRTVTITTNATTGTTPPPAGTVPPTPPQAGLTINPEAFNILGMTFNEIVARHGPVVHGPEPFQGSYYYFHENGLGDYFYTFNERFRVDNEADGQNFRLFTIVMTAQELFLDSFVTLNRNDFQDAFGVTVSEIWRNEMDGGYGFYFTYRNAHVHVASQSDGTVRSNAQVSVVRPNA